MDSKQGGGYALLLTILNNDPQTHPWQLTHSQDAWTYDHIAEHLVKMANSSTNISAPAVKDGSFINVLPLAVKESQFY